MALPLFAGLLGGGIWATLVPLDQITWRMRATGGGALTELVRIAWQGPPNESGLAATTVAAIPSMLMLLALTALLWVAAVRTFRWNPRH